jgi:hypothetical protein
MRSRLSPCDSLLLVQLKSFGGSFGARHKSKQGSTPNGISRICDHILTYLEKAWKVERQPRHNVSQRRRRRQPLLSLQAAGLRLARRRGCQVVSPERRGECRAAGACSKGRSNSRLANPYALQLNCRQTPRADSKAQDGGMLLSCPPACLGLSCLPCQLCHTSALFCLPVYVVRSHAITVNINWQLQGA